MTTENKEELLRLYKLLWEQIKDKDITQGLCSDCYRLFTSDEFDIISDHIQKNMPVLIHNNRVSIFGWRLNSQGTADRKSFVQRMITELENEIK
jgi:hypothetical protein